MAQIYDIVFENQPMGTAHMERQGLYFCFSCRCRLPGDGMYRIHALCGDRREDLGICVPMDGAFGMDKRLPAKRLGEGSPTFELLPKDWQPPEEVIPEVAAPAPEEEIPAAVVEEEPSVPEEEVPAVALEEVAVPEEEVPAVAVEEEASVPVMEEEIQAPAEEIQTSEAAEAVEEKFIPVSEVEPFEHLDQLENATMAVQDDQTGVIIENENET